MDSSQLAQIVEAVPFPDPAHADAAGLLAYGGDLQPERLLSAYARGIFPWYESEPVLWFSPDPRMVLLPAELRLTRSLRKAVARAEFEVRFDTAFESVVRACAEAPRPGQKGTWITPAMIDAYCRLHELGFAHSVEAWRGEDLAGGAYGVSLGAAFFGESMFAKRSDASKVAFVHLVRQLEAWGFDFVDCQVHTDHLESLGASLWTRGRFLDALASALESSTRRGQWEQDTNPDGSQ
jgi:leucyl/phenylalanyl-tRNA--protein transferase